MGKKNREKRSNKKNGVLPKKRLNNVQTGVVAKGSSLYSLGKGPKNVEKIAEKDIKQRVALQTLAKRLNQVENPDNEGLILPKSISRMPGTFVFNVFEIIHAAVKAALMNGSPVAFDDGSVVCPLGAAAFLWWAMADAARRNGNSTLDIATMPEFNQDHCIPLIIAYMIKTMNHQDCHDVDVSFSLDVFNALPTAGVLPNIGTRDIKYNATPSIQNSPFAPIGLATTALLWDRFGSTAALVTWPQVFGSAAKYAAFFMSAGDQGICKYSQIFKDGRILPMAHLLDVTMNVGSSHRIYGFSITQKDAEMASLFLYSGSTPAQGFNYFPLTFGSGSDRLHYILGCAFLFSRMQMSRKEKPIPNSPYSLLGTLPWKGIHSFVTLKGPPKPFLTVNSALVSYMRQLQASRGWTTNIATVSEILNVMICVHAYIGIRILKNGYFNFFSSTIDWRAFSDSPEDWESLPVHPIFAAIAQSVAMPFVDHGRLVAPTMTVNTNILAINFGASGYTVTNAGNANTNYGNGNTDLGQIYSCPMLLAANLGAGAPVNWNNTEINFAGGSTVDASNQITILPEKELQKVAKVFFALINADFPFLDNYIIPNSASFGSNVVLESTKSVKTDTAFQYWTRKVLSLSSRLPLDAYLMGEALLFGALDISSSTTTTDMTFPTWVTLFSSSDPAQDLINYMAQGANSSSEYLSTYQSNLTAIEVKSNYSNFCKLEAFYSSIVDSLVTLAQNRTSGSYTIEQKGAVFWYYIEKSKVFFCTFSCTEDFKQIIHAPGSRAWWKTLLSGATSATKSIGRVLEVAGPEIKQIIKAVPAVASAIKSVV